MSRLVSKILLTLLLLPLAMLVYLIGFAVLQELWRQQTWTPHRTELVLVYSGLVMWAFVVGYWLLLWKKSVRWDDSRMWGTPALAVAAIIGGALTALSVRWIDEELSVFIGMVTAPLLWLLGTILLWRESAAERAERLADSGRNALVCPTCGYNLTGLTSTRCPECGTQLTLESLVAAQPARETAELTD
jgi:hypothetical protein